VAEIANYPGGHGIKITEHSTLRIRDIRDYRRDTSCLYLDENPKKEIVYFHENPKK